MPKRNNNPWPARRRTALRAAERHVETQRCFPIDLGEVAASCWVRKIHFMHLLTDGGLAVRNGGFIIYVRCDPGEGDDLSARFEEDGTGSTLPERVRHRARFTIAHELAHTLFYDLRSLPPELKFELNAAAETRLELACNEIAGALLLPRRLLQQRTSTVRNITPRELRHLAKQTLVSPQTLVRRFAQMEAFPHPEAILASVAFVEHEWVITAISIHYSLRAVFSGAKAGLPVSALVDHPDFVLLGGETTEVGVNYVGHGGEQITMSFSSELTSSKARRGGFFVTGTPVSASTTSLRKAPRVWDS